ncbi:MAG: AraC family transcriptional regulator [Ruminococcus flavefaciens]|nr:AraC family transcriptional regulator [Ruminococcus flavefaciens]MCM1229495.1 AraC family transcriptional regulator [Ruminococcus flavefaciens]
MKITDIVLSHRQAESVKRTDMQDYCLYLFRNPVIFNIDGAERIYSGCTAILYSSGKKQYFRGSADKKLKYDMVCFRPSPSDRQYMADMDIPFDTPVELNDDFIIASAIKSMKIHSDMSKRRKSEFSELYMRIILISLEDAYSSIKAEKKAVPKYPKLKELRNAVYDNPLDEWSVDKVCRRLSISRTYFHRIYTEAFGITFTQDVIESRILYASKLLEDTELSVSLIAEKCGYDSDSYFMRQFRKHRGCTPSEYRKKKLSDSVG